tara:strand:- start:307 stop:648 length:342 start_codon:yes stop_codon:yes gene_type:complete
MRSVEEIRNSIKDLIEKAESAEAIVSQEPNHSSDNQEAGVAVDSELSNEIFNQINLEVTEFQKAFKGQGAEGLIAQSIRDTIRPVLEEWLKTNLPIIVKEVVDEKINEIRKNS